MLRIALSVSLFLCLAACSDGAPSSGAAPAPQPGLDAAKAPASGASTLPEGHPPIGGMPAGHPSIGGAGGMGGAGGDPGFTWTAPAGWAEGKPTNTMRVGQFTLPSGIECVLYGNSIGGSTEENVDRWIAQFSQPDGKASKDAADVKVTEKDGVRTTRLALSGTYSSSFMGGSKGDAGGTAKTAIRAAVVETAGKRVFVKLVGPEADVEAAEAAFDALLASFKKQ